MPPRILIVDDDPDVRDALRDVLEDEGYEVELADGGAAGLAAIARAPRPCIVLLDLMMPEVSGWDVLRTAGSGDGVRFVVLSAVRPEAMPEGVPWLRKPVALGDLLAVVRAAGG